jgi:hypothetical protein
VHSVAVTLLSLYGTALLATVSGDLVVRIIYLLTEQAATAQI